MSIYGIVTPALLTILKNLIQAIAKDLFIKIRTRSVVTLLLFLYEFL